MNKTRILIVEDEAVIAMEIESQLQSLGYEVTSIVNTGEKAIKKAEVDKPDLMLMDIRLKGDQDGIDTAEVIRNRFKIPIIFSTAYLDQERIERAKITMPFGYVLKPIQERDLKVTLEMTMYVSKVDAERRQMEEILRFEKARAQQYVEVAGVLLIALDINGCITLVNPKGCEILGYKQEEIIGRNWFGDFLSSENIDEIKQVFNQIISGDIEPVEYYENPIIRKDGSQRYIAWHNSVLRDGSGTISGLFSSGEDITESRQAEIDLKRSEEKLKLVMDGVLVPIVFVDSELRYNFVNKAYTDWYNTSKEDIEGKYIRDLLAEDVFERALPHYHTVLSGKPVTFENKTIREGEEKYVSVNLVPHCREDKVVGFFSTIMDITDRKQAEEERNKTITQLQDALETIKKLSGLLPICSNCKKVRDDKGYWNQIESYIEQHSEAQFSHGLCQECAELLYKDSKWYQRMKKDGKL
ncbi:PAS domain S-box protein [bacterium]|nr:PAS domain S-box protein [bacterium]